MPASSPLPATAQSGTQPFKPTARLARFSLLACCLALAGCLSSAGIQHDQALTAPASVGASAAYSAWPASDWWKSLHDPALDALIEQALQHNPSLVQSAKRMDKAAAYADAARAALAPRVDGSLDISRQRLSENSFYPPPYGGSTQTIANGSLNAAWDLDFWGQHRSALQAALSQTQAAGAEQAANRLVIATAVAQTYYQLARRLEQQQLAEQALQQREQELTLVRERLASGLDTQVELKQGQGTLYAAKVEVQASGEAVALTRNALAELTAQDAQQLQALRPTLTSLPGVLPEGIPADLIGRRPDLAAARAAVDAASAEVAATHAEFYPNVSLSAFIGLSSFGLSKFLDLGSTVAGAGPALHLPIFDAGRLRASLKGKNADLDIAIAGYNQALLKAVHDVADQVTSLHAVRQQSADQQAALDAAEDAYRLAGIRYRAGLTTYLTVLVADDAVLRERGRMLDLRARTLDLDIALIRSLGGGFDASAMTPASAS